MIAFKAVFLIFLGICSGNQDLIVGGFGKNTKKQCEAPLRNFLEKHGYGTSVNFDYEVIGCQVQVVAGRNFKINLSIY